MCAPQVGTYVYAFRSRAPARLRRRIWYLYGTLPLSPGPHAPPVQDNRKKQHTGGDAGAGQRHPDHDCSPRSQAEVEVEVEVEREWLECMNAP